APPNPRRNGGGRERARVNGIASRRKTVAIFLQARFARRPLVAGPPPVMGVIGGLGHGMDVVGAGRRQGRERVTAELQAGRSGLVPSSGRGLNRGTLALEFGIRKRRKLGGAREDRPQT